ncbi:hypothetical protein [Novosphingobium rosa]|uniref:hypothetical protein n=1 Tax=Novosphingobium rosa TaxID=76978 RepID=UPI000832B51B|nr:hypothetical protein [Novosphingobium rosa]
MRWLISLAALFVSPSTAALAATASADTTPTEGPPAFTHSKGLSDEDLDMLRGGFELQGVSISLGAQLNTYLNGQLVMATTLNWTTSGASSTTSTMTLTPASEASLQAVVTAGGTFGMSSSGGQAYITNSGQTLIYQNAANGLQNVLINTASGVNANQTINATVGIAGYAGYSSANLAASLGRTLGAAVGMAGIH